MSRENMPRLEIGDRVAKVPIIQGGMSVGISLAGLASAVANEGGIGVIGAAGIGAAEPDIRTNYKNANKRALSTEIRRARSLSDGLLGVNIMLALSDWDEMVLTSFDEGADFVFIGSGLLLRPPPTLDLVELNKQGTKIIPVISGAKGARVLFTYWAKNYDYVPEAIVIEGPKAGGHLGFRKEDLDKPENRLEEMIPQVVELIKPFEERFDKRIPVIAAGGIFTGADIWEIMKLGASGVQMATRFVGTHECDASIKFKEAYLNSSKDDIMIIDSPVGMPGRAIRNQFLEDVSAGKKVPFLCPWKCLRTCDYRESPYCIAEALLHAKEGKFEDGFAFAGENAYRVNEIVSVRELMDTIADEYDRASKGLPV